ncbi:hypothetical protein POF43_034180, partial [Streptomyces sp. SL54]|nr:hypothetical protein [Streptantibioticus silvisoli]
RRTAPPSAYAAGPSTGPARPADTDRPQTYGPGPKAYAPGQSASGAGQQAYGADPSASGAGQQAYGADRSASAPAPQPHDTGQQPSAPGQQPSAAAQPASGAASSAYEGQQAYPSGGFTGLEQPQGRHARARAAESARAAGSGTDPAPASLGALGFHGSGAGWDTPAFRPDHDRDRDLDRDRDRDRDGGPGGRRGPRRLGLLLLVVILLALAGLVAYAMAFGKKPASGPDRSLPAQVSTGGSPATPSASSKPAAPTTTAPAARTTAPEPQLATGFSMRHDPSGFTLAVHDGWSRSAGPDHEVGYASGGDTFRLTVVRGRDAASASGGDPITYETQKEPELAAFRASTWSSSSDLKDLQVNGLPAAEGQFSWRDPHTGVELYGLNLAILRDGHFDVVLLTGPDDQRQLVTDYFNQSAQTFRAE